MCFSSDGRLRSLNGCDPDICAHLERVFSYDPLQLAQSLTSPSTHQVSPSESHLSTPALGSNAVESAAVPSLSLGVPVTATAPPVSVSATDPSSGGFSSPSPPSDVDSPSGEVYAALSPDELAELDRDDLSSAGSERSTSGEAQEHKGHTASTASPAVSSTAAHGTHNAGARPSLPAGVPSARSASMDLSSSLRTVLRFGAKELHPAERRQISAVNATQQLFKAFLPKAKGGG